MLFAAVARVERDGLATADLEEVVDLERSFVLRVNGWVTVPTLTTAVKTGSVAEKLRLTGCMMLRFVNRMFVSCRAGAVEQIGGYSRS
ncbi:hypothetical protein ACIOMQ_36270 [Streptomyces sp. NPDC087845]|uniref:hypothetical protein n=1 Tax=Streptomyces sp. NPDC087845 TaxID=3365806 RepID=UPI003806BBAF